MEPQADTHTALFHWHCAVAAAAGKKISGFNFLFIFMTLLEYWAKV